MKKNKNIKKYIIISAYVVVIIGAILGVLIYMNSSKSGYTLLEKRWLSENKNTTLTIKTDNTLPVFSYNGEGIYYNYIEDLEKDTDLTFDVINTDGADYEFIASNKRNKKNILFYTDNYIVVSKLDKEINSIDELKSEQIGVLKDDLSYVSYYFGDEAGMQFKSYENYSKLTEAMGDEINYIIIPKYEYLEDIVDNKYNISYNLDGLNRYFELRVKSNNKELNSVMQKLLNQWQKRFNQKYNEYSLNFYVEKNDLSQLQLEAITKKDLTLGYIKNIPYEGNIQRKFTGLTNEYLSGFSAFTGTTFNHKEYKNTKALNKDLNKDKIDIVLNYTNLTNVNYNNTRSIDMPNYVVLAHNSNNIVVNNIYSLKDSKVTMLKNNDLTKKFKNKDIFAIEEVENVKQLFKKTDENTIIVIDKIVYDSYKNSKFKKYNIVYQDENIALYNFLINKNNETLYNLFDYYISVNSNKKIASKASYDTYKAIKGNTAFGFIINNILYFTLGLLIVLFIIWKFKNKVKVKKKIKKEDKMMYIDAMTNLKNRNYLNDNMDIWDDNNIFPQTVIVLDVDNIKEINDVQGREEGDRQIKAVANILINTQRENSEIIRTDGNEFLIYLIGYEEKIITTYMHKLNREFKNLPYDYGVHFGYSMITSEIKSLDDAINESLAMIKEQEEK